jgi:hypothetical protein
MFKNGQKDSTLKVKGNVLDLDGGFSCIVAWNITALISSGMASREERKPENC